MTEKVPPAQVPPALAAARDAFEDMVTGIRPDLHRYCARMMGSVFDGEDVLQDALAKAFYALSGKPEVNNLRGWLFRIAHNAALDHLRARGRRVALPNSGPSVPAPEPVDPTDPYIEVAARQAAASALGLFMHLPPRQRSCVILRDVLGHSAAEVAVLLGISPGAVKAALHRGRTALRAAGQAATPQPATASLDPREQALLTAYIARFNARDFDAVRDMLADEVRLDLVGRVRQQGRALVGNYASNYACQTDWHLHLGVVDGTPAILVTAPDEPPTDPKYFIRLTWTDTGEIAHILDFRYAPYTAANAHVAVL